jgi:hypothetical protein
MSPKLGPLKGGVELTRVTPALFQNLNFSRQFASSPAPVETQTSAPMLAGSRAACSA